MCTVIQCVLSQSHSNIYPQLAVCKISAHSAAGLKD